MPRNKGTPHYQRIIDRILSSPTYLNSGGRLPSERALARRYGVARNTARRALQELAARGSVLRMRGSGTFRAAISERIVLAYGYALEHEPFTRLFRVLTQSLANQGIQLVVKDIGITGERFQMTPELPQLQRAEAAVLMAPSHPEGIRVMVRFRRRFPKLLPLLLIGESLGLKLQGRHRFDFVHYDFRASAAVLFKNLLLSDYKHPVFIARSDNTIFNAREAREGFCAALQERGLEVRDHCIDWDLNNPQSLSRCEILRARNSQPDVFVLTHGYDHEFRAVCRKLEIDLAPDVAFASVGESRHNFLNSAELARICGDLLLNRLNKPNRSNLNIVLAIPEKFRRPF